MNDLLKTKGKASGGYQEESPRLAITLTVLAVVLVGAPLALANKKISDEGSQSADISKYAKLVKVVDDNVQIVQEVLEKGVVQESVLAAGGIVSGKGTTLITPPVMPTNISESGQDSNGLDIVLSAIYWNPRQPLVTIDDENYYVGDKIKGYTIMEIRKTEVVFRSPSGEKIMKYFYDYLD